MMSPVRRNLGPGTASGAPVAVRPVRVGWRDPRLWFGIALVAVCVVVGSRVMASADDTVEVYVAADPLPVGTPIGEAALRKVAARLPEEVLAGLVTPGQEPAPDAVLATSLPAGALVPRHVVVDPGELDLVQVPISVDPEQVPPSVGTGSVIDLYLLQAGGPAGESAEPALAGVSVVAAPDPADALVASNTRQLVLAVPDQRARDFFALMEAAEQPTLTVVRRQ